MAVFYLPNHDSQVTNDPLGLSDTNEDVTPVWPIVVAVLDNSNRPETPGQFVDLLDTIAYTIHAQPSKVFASLLWFLGEIQQSSLPCTDAEQLLLSDVSSSIFDLALELPKCFPSGTVNVLCPNTPCSFTRKQLGVLLAHQALGTLNCPSWNDWGGVNLWQWYADGGDRKLKASYMTLAFKYLIGLSKEPDNSEYSSEVLDFYLHESQSIPNFETSQYPLLQLNIKELKVEDDIPPVLTESTNKEGGESENNNALVIACHPLVGHGPTATQEERIIASYPELLPVSIITPPLREETSLIVSSTRSPFHPTGRFEGHGRSATLMEIYNLKQHKVGIFDKFIFMDASQQDIDSNEDNKSLERDLVKAYSGFSGALRGLPPACHTNFVTVPWGAGAFGGNLYTNMHILWLASSIAAERNGQSASLVFKVKEGLMNSYDGEWDKNTRRMQKEETVGVLLKRLKSSNSK